MLFRPIAYIVDANDLAGGIVHRLITRKKGFAEDHRIAIVRFIPVDGLIALPLGSRLVPMAREPSSFFTSVATRT